MEIRELSNCCGARLIENTDLCSKCREHCDIVEEEVTSIFSHWLPREEPDFSLFSHWKDEPED